MRVTIMTAIPLIPDLDIPIINEAKNARTQEVVVISNGLKLLRGRELTAVNKSILKNNIFNNQP
jgi:hypothetical protein